MEGVRGEKERGRGKEGENDECTISPAVHVYMHMQCVHRLSVVSSL